MRAICLSLLILAGTASHAADTQGVPGCKDNAKSVSPGQHGIKLTWRASVPASSRAGSQIVGYNLYRSESGSCDRPSKKCTPLNYVLIDSTSCVDYTVRSGHTYAYRVQAVTVNTIPGSFSNEAKAKAP